MTRGRRITRTVAVGVAMTLFFTTLIAFFVGPYIWDARMRRMLGDENAVVTDTARTPWIYVDENGVATPDASSCLGKEELVIPSAVNGIKVTGFDMNFTPPPYWVKRITFPPTLRSIGSFPFKDWSDIEEIVFEEGIEDLSMLHIGGKKKLCRLVLPASVKSVCRGMLTGASPDLVVYFGGTEAEWLAMGKATEEISQSFTVIFESDG